MLIKLFKLPFLLTFGYITTIIAAIYSIIELTLNRYEK